MTTFILLLGVLAAALAAIGFLSWLLEGTGVADDSVDSIEVEDEDTLWFDPRTWPIIDRLFGEKPPRLPHMHKDDASDDNHI